MLFVVALAAFADHAVSIVSVEPTQTQVILRQPDVGIPHGSAKADAEPDAGLVERLRTNVGGIPHCCVLTGDIRAVGQSRFDCILYIDVLEDIELDLPTKRPVLSIPPPTSVDQKRLVGALSSVWSVLGRSGSN